MANVPIAKLIHIKLVDWVTCTVNQAYSCGQTHIKPLGSRYYSAKRGVPPRDPITHQISLQRTMNPSQALAPGAGFIDQRDQGFAM